MNHLNQLTWAFFIFFLFGSCHGVQREKTWITIHGPDGQVLEIGKDPDSNFFGIRMGKPGMPFYREELSGKESGFLPRITIEGDEQLLGMGFFTFHGVIESLSWADSVSYFGLSLKRKKSPYDWIFDLGLFDLGFSIGPFGLVRGKEGLNSLGPTKSDSLEASGYGQGIDIEGDADQIYGVFNGEKLFEIKKKGN